MNTLQDVFNEMGASLSEVERMRALITSGKYRMQWTNAQWYNRMQGRTCVSSAERVALHVVLERVRREQLPLFDTTGDNEEQVKMLPEGKNRTHMYPVKLHSAEEFIDFINNADIALRVTRRCIYNDDGELVAILVD